MILPESSHAFPCMASSHSNKYISTLHLNNTFKTYIHITFLTLFLADTLKIFMMTPILNILIMLHKLSPFSHTHILKRFKNS